MRKRLVVAVASLVLAGPLLSTPTAQAASEAAVTAQASELLMTWYSDAGFKGSQGPNTGSAGTCDTAGYSFFPNAFWQFNLSSIRGHGQCNAVRLTNRAGTAAQTFGLPVSFGGTIYNDNVGHVQVFHR